MDQKELNKLRSRIQIASQNYLSGKQEEAGDIYDEISNLADSNPVLNADLGNLCSLFGATDKALRHFQVAVEQDPENPEYLSFLGIAQLNTGDKANAKDSFTTALDLDSETTAALYGIGLLNLEDKNYQEGIRYLEDVLKKRSKDSNILLNLGKAYRNMGDYAKAQDYLSRAIKIDPSHTEAQTALGEILAETGQKEAAQKHYEHAIRSKSDVGSAYLSIAKLRKFSTKDSALIAKVEKALEQGMPSQQRFLIHFALGKMYDDCEQYEQAFQHYNKANLLQKQPYNLKGDLSWQKLIFKTFTADAINTISEHGHPSPLPVFIIGMPRTGTTLLERIIGSHSLADGAGELMEMPRLLQKLVDENNPRTASKLSKRLTEEEINSHAEDYLKALSGTSKEAQRIVDKLPGNYMSVGLILSLFPNATIINISRNPLDTCLSCYFQGFQQVYWSNSFEDIVGTYKIYRNYLDHWRAILPEGKILEVQYENLIENSEAESRRVIEHCGLEWEPDILNFHEKETVVRTASRWQVRQPIYKTSKMRWKNYAPYIQDLAQDLSEYLQEDLESLEQNGIKLTKPKRFGIF